MLSRLKCGDRGYLDEEPESACSRNTAATHLLATGKAMLVEPGHKREREERKASIVSGEESKASLGEFLPGCN